MGASLSPDSASSAPTSRRDSGRPRSTEKTAAASVGEVTAPSRTDSSQEQPEQQWAPTATIADRDRRRRASPARRPSRIDGRTSNQLVVRPPSARISARAAKPSAWASSAFLEVDPDARSPRATTPISR